MHQVHIPQCTILQQKYAYMCTFLLQNGASWAICEMGLYIAVPWQYRRLSPNYMYCQTYNIKHPLGSKVIDHSDVVGALPVSNNFILDLTPGFREFDKDNYKMRRETFKFWVLVWIILEVWLLTTDTPQQWAV